MRLHCAYAAGLAGLVFAASVCAAVAGEVLVRDFGAVAGDGRDDTLAVAKAIEQCRSTPLPVLKFDSGVYNFAAGSDRSHPEASFVIAGIDDLEIRGDRTQLLFSGNTSCFYFHNCKRLKISGLDIDWERPPFSIGKVVASEDRHFDLDVWDEYPVKGGEPVGALMDYDPVTLIPAKRAIDIYNGVEKTELLAPQRLRVHLANPARLPVGNLVVLRHQVYGYNALGFGQCADVTVQDVNVYCVPGMGLVGSVSRDIKIRRFNVRPRPVTPDQEAKGRRSRIMSATADAMHFGGCQGNIEVEECWFEGMGDDAINIKSGLYLSIREIKDRKTVLAQHNLKMVDLPGAGDRVELSHVDTLLSYADAVVESASLQDGGEGLIEVRLKDSLPPETRVGDVLGNATRTPRVRIYDVTVRANRARGFLLQTRDVLVDRCSFRDITSGGVWVMTEVVYFFESIGTRNVLVRNCDFDNCNYGGPMGEGVLSVQAYLADFGYPATPGVHRNIRLENNTVRGTDNCGIFVTGVSNIGIRGNRLTDVCRNPTRPFGSSAIYITGSEKVTLEGNSVAAQEQGAGFKQALQLGPGVDEATLKIRGNSGF